MTPVSPIERFEHARRELAHAYDTVVFFREHMDASGLTPGDIDSPEKFRTIPPTDKQQYRVNFPSRVLPTGVSLSDPPLTLYASSGTTIERSQTAVYDFCELHERWAVSHIDPVIGALMFGGKVCLYAPPNCSAIECANPNTTMAERMTRGNLVLQVHHDLYTTPERMTDQSMREIQELEPKMFWGGGTHMAFLYQRMRRAGFDPPRVPMVSGAEQLTHTVRRQLSECFTVRETLGMSEFSGRIMFECPHGRLHLNNKFFYAEVLVGNRPAEPGELGSLYLTTLGACSPHIRYRTGDLVTLTAEECPCMSFWPVLRMEGRSRYVLARAGRILATPKQLDDVVGPAPWVHFYQLKQRDEDRFVFSFIPSDSYQGGEENELEERLRERLGASSRFSFERTPYIAAERSGKLTACKSAVTEQLVDSGRADGLIP